LLATRLLGNPMLAGIASKRRRTTAYADDSRKRPNRASRRSRRRQCDRLLVERLQELEHRAILVVEQTLRYMHAVIRCDADEVLVEGTVVDGAKTQAVLDKRLSALVEIADDVRGVE
jgi:hypothetical protein